MIFFDKISQTLEGFTIKIQNEVSLKKISYYIGLVVLDHILVR